MSHGIEIYNSNGRLIYTSERKTPRIHAYGTITLEGGGLGPYYIEFPPISEPPQLFVANAGLFYPVPHPQLPNVWYRYSYLVGPIETDGLGRYYRVPIRIGPISPFAPGYYINPTPTPWHVPWVVFI